PTILREWNNSGSEYVYNEIPNTGTTAILDLDGYVGTYYVAFYGESTLTGGDNDFHFDNVTVRETPESPIISVTPDTWDFGTHLINTTTSQSFTIANDGGAPLILNSVNVTGTGFALADTFSPISLLPAESTTITVNFSPLTEANYSGNIVISDNRAPTNIPLTGAAIDATIYAGDLPYLENFDAVTVPDLPLGWSTRVTDTSTYGYVKTATSGYSTPNRVTMYNSSDAASDLILITAPIDVALNTLRVKFMAYGGTGYSLQVGTADTAGQDATFTAFETVNPTGAWTQYSVTLSGYVGTDQYLAFKHGQGGTYRTIYIDDVAIEIPAPNPPEPANLVWPLNGITTLLNPLLKWTPSATGEPVTSYKVYMNDSGTFSESDMIYEGTDTQFQTADMGYERTYYWKVLPINANGSDPTCPTWSFSTPLESQLAEGFEATAFPPAGWQRTTSSTSYWGRSTTSPLEGAAGMYAYTSTSTVYTISSPMLTITSSSSLDFFAKVTDVTQKLQILESTDRVNWTQVGADITFATANVWNPISVNLSVIEPG
ncbi:MAG TPA: choice-of-anchor J domain-containing protein, partial [Candidatus Cloacimonadota bacterium]|nr:choice-of-anchor J domain-containing protein [Candidatus Cloacimonadota bacterium]